MRILITGGAGLIGQAIARKHIELGDTVYIYDTQINIYNDYINLDGIVLDRDITIKKALIESKPDIISNQASRVGVGQSQYEILDYVHNNICSTAELIQAVVDLNHNVKRIIHAGSMGPYGDLPSGLRVDEDYGTNPESIYAVTKDAQEKLLKVFSKTYNIPTISLRYFSVYATNQTPLNPYTGVLSVIANQLLNNDKVEMYEDGSQTRDLINVEDIAEAHFVASRKNLKQTLFIPINIATGVSTDLLYIAERMRDLLAPEKKIIFNGKHRAGDVMHVDSDISLMINFLEWYPKYDIDTDIIEYCSYIEKNREKFTVRNTIKEEQTKIERLGLIHGS